MKKILLLLIVTLVYSNILTAQSWFNRASLPSTARGAAKCFSINNIGYIVGGETSSGVLTDFWSYNSSSNSWTSLAPFPGASRQLPASFAINGFGYYGLGIDSTFYKYDPVANSWSSIPGPSLNVSYWSPMFFTIGTDAYILFSSSNVFVKFNSLNNTWTTMANFPGTVRFTGSGFSANNKGYITCGVNSWGSPYLNDLWEYDPATNTWTQKASMPSAGKYATLGLSTSNKGYILGGETKNPTNTSNEIWEYNPTNNAWTQLPNTYSRNYLSGFVLNNKIYAAFGGFGYHNDLFVLDTLSPQVSPVNYCLNGPATALVAIANPGCTLNWYGTNATGGTASSTAPIPSTASVGVTNYYVSQVNSFGYESPRSIITVTVSTTYDPTLIAQDTIKACGDSVLVSATNFLGPYLWSTGQTTNSIYAKTTGWYKVTAYPAAFCALTDSVFISILHVDINQNDTAVCANTVLNLKAGLIKPRLTNLFNGTSTYFEMPLPGPIGATQRTFAYWLKSNNQSTMTVLTYGSALNGGPDIVDLCLNLNMGYGAASGGCAQYNKGVSSFSNSFGATFGKLVTDSVWHHIAYVMGTGNNYSFQNFKVYVDGHLVSMNANGIPYCGHNWGGWTYNTSSSIMRLGRNYSNNPYSGYFKGDLDELAVWSKALDSAQINKVMSLGVMSLDSQLMYYYNFEKLIGDTLLSDLKSGNHGVLKGGGLNYATNYYLDTTSAVGYNYLWSTGATTPSINVTPTQTTKYWVKVSNGISSCTDTVTVTVFTNYSSTLIMQDTIKACGDSVLVSANSGLGSYSWSNGKTTNSFYAKSTGWYKVIITPSSGCVLMDSVFVSILKANIIQNDTAICPGTTIVLNAKVSANNLISYAGQSYEVANASPSKIWGPMNNITTNATSMTNGLQNTLNAVNVLGNYNNGDYAANYCLSLVENGIDDWYLPSWNELTNALCANSAQIPNWTSPGYYWSSTEQSNPNWTYKGYSGSLSVACGSVAAPYKTDNCIAKCIRKAYNITYLWSTGATTPSISVSPNVTSKYWVQISNGISICSDTVNISMSTLSLTPSVSPVTYCQNAIATALTATATTGCTLNWYGTNATGGTASTTAPTPNTAIVGTTTYYVSQTNANGCEGPRTAITVSINPLPSSPTVNNISYCQNAIATALSATATTGCTLNWYGTNATGGTASAMAPTPSTAIAGTVTYYVSQTNANGCEGSRASIIVTINALPAAPTTSNLVYCQNATAIALTATALAGHTLNWYGTNATGGTASATAPTPSTAIVGTSIFYVSQTNVFGCEGARASILVTTNALPTAASTSPINYCQNAVALSLTATASLGCTLNWYGTNAIGGTASASAPTPSTLSLGSTTYFVSQTNAIGCEGPRSSIVVSVLPVPVAPITTPKVYCQNAIASALTATAAPGCTLNWYGTNATGGTASATAPIPNTAIAGTATYYVSQTNANGCEGPRASIIVTINALPAAPSVSPVSYCQNSTAGSLTATAAPGCTLNWYGTNAIGGTASATAPTPSTAIVGTTTYYVSQTNANGCEGPRASIIVTINALPAAPVTNPKVYCQNATAIALTATALAGHTLNWYGTNATGGTASTSAPTPSTATIGTTLYYVSQTNATGCEGPRASIVVSINTIPAAPIANNIALCQNATAISLTAIAVPGNTLNWYGTNATGGIASASASIPSTVNVGTTTYYVSQTNAGGCEGPRASILVTINALPAAPVTNPKVYCQNAIASALTATAAPGCTLNWYGTNATGGMASTTAPIPNTSIAGTTMYYVSQTNANGCEGPRATIIVTINPSPSAPIVWPVNYCQNTTAIALTATTLPGCTLNWYGTNATGGSASSTAPTPSTAIVGSTMYYVSQTNANGCEGPRASIIVTVNALPTTPSINNISICQNAIALALTANAASGCSLNWYGTNAIGGTASATAPTPSTAIVGTTTYYVSQTNANGCEGPRASIMVTVNALPIFNLTHSGNIDFCEGDSIELKTTPINNYTYKWFLNNNQIPNAFNYNYYAKYSGKHRVEVYSSNLCMAKDSISIFAHPWPVIKMENRISSSPGEQVTLTSMVTNYNSLIWTPAANLSCSNCLNPILNVVNPGYYVLTATNLGGCSTSDSVFISVTCSDDLIKIANTFTPNEDGYNDYAYPQTKGLTKIIVFRIVSRWGELMFENKDFDANVPIRGWDGRFKGQLVMDDVFTYYLEAQCTDGSVIAKTGNINILK